MGNVSVTSILEQYPGSIETMEKNITTLEVLENQMKGLSNTIVFTLDLSLASLEQMEQTVERVSNDVSVIRISKQDLSGEKIKVKIYRYEPTRRDCLPKET